ncbi:glycosyltransferase family 90 protein [Peniophora sp. CONT]|nr:glycosyltransferase family 90 protein [Peniophora sp. CONT]
MDDAERQFRNKLKRQSRSLKAAVSEYKRRYGRAPPKGFDAWWKFAHENGVKMVDEFDGLMEDLQPFMEMSGKEFRARAAQAAAELPGVDVVRIRSGLADAVKLGANGEGEDAGMRAKGFLRMLSKFKKNLPDMDFVVNARAEGRVLIPWELQKYPNITTVDPSIGQEIQRTLHIPDWRGEGSVWDAFRRVCPPDTPARRLYASVRASSKQSASSYFAQPATPFDTDFRFARDVDARFDFCYHPWAHINQGHFFSDWRTVPLPFPVLSPAKGPGFGDIRVPSHYYHGTTRRYTYAWDDINQELKQHDSVETAWERKSDKIFFRGATTGGGSSPAGFSAGYQRHRLVKMATDTTPLSRTLVFADPPGSIHFVYTKLDTPTLNQAALDVAFVSSVDHVHYPGGLQQQMTDHRFADNVLLRDRWAHKYVLDLDGAGYSGKFFAYLASDSAVIKSSVHREFYGDWIQPWLHYIPLSSGYRELYNVHAFFSGAPREALEKVNSTALALPEDERRSVDGDRRLRRIARAGKHWKSTIGRQVDMEAYVYRLCLEYARLWADDRKAASYR